ncbi:uncharacterized protein G2W53_005604 [Senna tora]|uniref:Uncharacterized protein n=1 Tax=Senna tora TaxID=362788 RepID=A0A835CFR1_9FABA|nr:uncharacterized protein G2W53_005604 [Senna tora]
MENENATFIIANALQLLPSWLSSFPTS